MKKLLITGGNGFIGLQLCKKCVERNIEFLALTERINPMSNMDCFVEANILNPEEMGKVIKNYQPDAIIHLAAIASPVHKNVAEIYNTNVYGTEILLDCAARYLAKETCVVLVSTAGVYGNQAVAHLDESLSVNPVNHYSYSKMVMEYLSRQYTDRLHIQIVRPFNIIGSGQKASFFIPKLVQHFVDKSPTLNIGNLDAVRDYISVDYCAEVMLQLSLSQKPANPILNICTGIGYSCKEVIELLIRLTGHSPELVTNQELVRNNEIWHLVGDTKNLLDFTKGAYQSKSLEEILRSMLSDASEA